VAMGYAALATQTTAGGNTAIGNLALNANTSGASNTSVGSQSLMANTTAGSCTAVGFAALTANTTGTLNTAIGHSALVACTTGTHNTAIGTSVLDALTTGVDNIGIGYGVGGHDVAMDTGLKNVLIGNYCDVSATDSTNQIVMGFNASGNANNSFVFGNGGTDSAISFGATSISAPSDIRLKQNINDDVAGLSFINDLRPVTYEWRKEKDIPEEMLTHKAGSEERYNNDFINHGFIAQEVKEVIDNHPEIKDGFKMWSEDERDGRQRIAEGALVTMLVKSVQELSTKNDSLETSNTALIARIEALENA